MIPAGTSQPIRLALVLGAALCFVAGTSRPAGVSLALVLLVVLALQLRWQTGLLAIVALGLVGIVLRAEAYRAGASDVLDVTVAAIERVLAGGNPYGVGYAETDPPGAPFPYGPLSLLWYLPFRHDPERFEFVISLVTLALLTVRGHPVGLALYATFPPLLTVASDGANDTSAGLLLLGALVAVRRVGPAGGALLGAAVAFKPFAVAWLPALLLAGGATSLLGFAVASALAWLPALLLWGAGPMATSLALAQEVHRAPYYSLAEALEALTRQRLSAELFERLRLVLGVATAALTAPFVRSATGIVASGLLVYAVTLYTGYWATFAYLAAIAPAVCWYLDHWLGLGANRVPWPADPVGRLTAVADERWPLRPEERASRAG